MSFCYTYVDAVHTGYNAVFRGNSTLNFKCAIVSHLPSFLTLYTSLRYFLASSTNSMFSIRHEIRLLHLIPFLKSAVPG